MERVPLPDRSLTGLAALARIDEMSRRRRTRMTAEQTDPAAGSDEAMKAAARQVWALGDYHRFAKATVWELGQVLVDACEISPGHRVLDVACGTGNTAIRAARAGASVVASDLTPENFPAGRREAAAQDVELEWIDADAEALPFADDDFDVVTSSVGAIFAPHHQRVADEMVRVCRPGGSIGMINFTPDGLIGDFFDALGPYAPAPPPDASPPPLWGSEGHVRELFADRVDWLTLRRDEYVERADDPRAYCRLFTETFGPVVAIHDSLAGDADRLAAFERDFLDFATRTNRGTSGGPAEYHYEYLLLVARKRACSG
jgi:ubiquinone/menaquinone biosynthesis C-methylase UbiE